MITKQASRHIPVSLTADDTAIVEMTEDLRRALDGMVVKFGPTSILHVDGTRTIIERDQNTGEEVARTTF